MGVVYQAQHPSLDRYAAVKFLAANLAIDKTYIDMFLREAKAAAKLNHPNIIAIYDAGSVGEDVYYLIMEYVEGRDLRSLLREQLVLPVSESIHYVRQVCSGLSYAHRKKIIHRDIKPENLLLTDEGIIKIGDLGLAKWMGEDSGSLTQTGLVMGSPFYIAPERLRGDPDVNESTDVYSLGGTFFHLVTGKVPYEGTAPVVMAKHLDSPVPNPLDVNPSLDPRLCEIIMKMMAKNQTDRFKNMQDVDKALSDYEQSLSHPVMRAIPTKDQSSTTLEISEELAKEGVFVAGVKSGSPGEAATVGASGQKKSSIPLGLIAGAAALVCAGLAWFFWPKEPPPAALTEPPPPAAPIVPTPRPAEPKITESAPKAAAAPVVATVTAPATPSLWPKPAPRSVTLVQDFEEGTEGWRIQHGFNMGGPTRSNDYAHSGKGSIVFRHYFKKDEESSSAYVTFQPPKDLSAYKELRMWVKFPDGDSKWTLQMYARSGRDNVQDLSPPYKAWLGDWHQIKLDVKDIEHPTEVREVGFHVKNQLEIKAAIYVDQIEAIAK